MYCHGCGTANEEKNKFCTNCGTQLKQSSSQSAPLTDKKQDKSTNVVLESSAKLRHGKVGWPKSVNVKLYDNKIIITDIKTGNETTLDLEGINNLELSGMNKVFGFDYKGKFYGLEIGGSTKRTATYAAFGGAAGALVSMLNDPSKGEATKWLEAVKQLKKVE